MDASSAPSGLKAIAMVDRGGGVSAQYVASQRRRKSPSAQPRSAALGSAAAPGPPARPHTRRPCGAASRARSISAALQPSRLFRHLSDAGTPRKV